MLEYWPVLLTAFSLGLLHALDADHVMAVSSFSNHRPGLSRSVAFCTRWAVGHGAVLLIAGGLLFGLGLSIPETWQVAAEKSVGVLLVVLGSWCLWSIHRKKVTLATHSHGDLEHTHWHEKDHRDVKRPSLDNHGPVFVGMLHGLAGSAPALALVPAVMKGDLMQAFGYLLLFSLGVLLSMFVFGLSFGWMQQKVNHYSERVFMVSRHALAFLSIGIGVFWFTQA